MNASADVFSGPVHAEASDISLLSFNATGEQRYLGPSSGSFFASYAAGILRSCAPYQVLGREEQGRVQASSESASSGGTDGQLPLHPSTMKLLQKSYEMWIIPLYPLISISRLNDLVARCAISQTAHPPGYAESSENTDDMVLFYLIMAIGAVNSALTLRQLRPEYVNAHFPDGIAMLPSSTLLYSMAMKHFQALAHDLQPKVPVIQMLLLVCVYSSHGPQGPSQWQLAGFAMRVRYTFRLCLCGQNRLQ